MAQGRGIVVAAVAFWGLCSFMSTPLQFVTCPGPVYRASSSPNRVQMSCDASNTGGNYQRLEAAQVVPPLSIFCALLLGYFCMSPLENSRSNRVVHNIPLTNAPPAVRKAIDSITPNKKQKNREEQQTLVTSCALVTPFVIASLATNGALPRPQER